MATFSDNFDRIDADSLGANWTEVAGDQDIASNRMAIVSGSYAQNLAIYSGTACSGADQFMKVTWYWENGYPEIIFRYTDGSTHYYILGYEGTGAIAWYHRSAVSGSSTKIGDNVSVSGMTNADRLCITIAGTGADTTIRLWRNQTANSPVSATEWDSGDTTPDATWTTDPGDNAVDSGTYMGLGGSSNAGSDISYEDFFGGDIPGGASSPTTADGTQTNNADTPALLQGHFLASVAGGSQACAGDDVTVGYNVPLSPYVCAIYPDYVYPPASIPQYVYAIRNTGVTLTVAETVQSNMADAPIPTQGVVLSSVADGAQVNAADAPAYTQAHYVTLTDGAQANIADDVTVAINHPISVSETSNASVADDVTMTIGHVLASAADGVQVVASGENYYLTDEEGNIITDEEGNPIVTEDSAGLTVIENLPNLNPANCYVANAADAPALTIGHGMSSVADGAQVNAGDAPAPTIGHYIASVSDGAQVNTSDAPALALGQALATVADTVQVNASDAPAPTQGHGLTAGESAVVNTADGPSLVQHHVLTVADGASENVADGVTLYAGGALPVSDGVQENVADSPAIVQHHVISVSETANENHADNVTLGVGADVPVTAADGAQANVSGAINLTQAQVITVDDGANLSVADALIVIIGHVISAQDSGQIVASDEITQLIQNHNVTIGDGTQEQHADGIDFSYKATPEDSYNANAADDIVLEVHTRTHGKKLRTTKSVRDHHRQSKIYVNTYRRAGDVWRSR